MNTPPRHHGSQGGLPATVMSHSAPLPALVDIETLAAALGVGVRHIRRLVAERRIPYVKVGHYVRFDVAEVAMWVDQHRVETFRPSLGLGR